MASGMRRRCCRWCEGCTVAARLSQTRMDFGGRTCWRRALLNGAGKWVRSAISLKWCWNRANGQSASKPTRARRSPQCSCMWSWPQSSSGCMPPCSSFDVASRPECTAGVTCFIVSFLRLFTRPIYFSVRNINSSNHIGISLSAVSIRVLSSFCLNYHSYCTFYLFSVFWIDIYICVRAIFTGAPINLQSIMYRYSYLEWIIFHILISDFS